MQKDSSFIVHIDEQSFPLQAKDVAQLDIVSTAANEYHLLKDGQSYKAQLLSVDYQKKIMTLSINGTKYSIKIEDEYDLLVKKMGLSVGGTQKMKNVKAPMPGLILDILIEPGQAVNKGDQLLILEAMKMENVLKAEGEGIIKSVEAIKGEAVDKGQILIEME